jgi:hypothetical protein
VNRLRKSPFPPIQPGLATLPLGPRSKVNPKAIINDLIKKYIFPVVNSGQVSFTGVNYSL